MPSPLRRFAAALAVIAVTSLALAAVSMAAGDTGGGGGGGGPITTHPNYTLTVTPPSRGFVTGDGINCTPASAAGSDACTAVVAYTCIDGDCGPAVTRTLSASSGASGFDSTWSGCTTVNGTGAAKTCDVAVDQDRTASVAWSDSVNPTVSFSTVAAKAGAAIAVSAAASDNDGVHRVEYYVDGVLR